MEDRGDTEYRKKLDCLLQVLLKRLADKAKTRGLRATPSGIREGIGFSYETPYIIAYGLSERGLIDPERCLITEAGEVLLDKIIETAKEIKRYSLFPELDRGKLLGALLYAFYDWIDEHRSSEDYLRYVEEIVERIKRVEKKYPEKFKILAVLLPRAGYEDRYTPLMLIDSIEKID